MYKISVRAAGSAFRSAKRLNYMRKIKKTAAALLSAVMIGGSAMIYGSAIVPGVSPNIDPTLIEDKTLPEQYDQGFYNGMPYGMFVVGDDASYSFGVAFDEKGNLYTASFNTSSVTVRKPDKNGKISLDSETETIKIGCAGLFCIAIDRNGDLLFSSCTDTNGYVGKYDMKTGKITKLLTGLVRPNQMTTDADNNVYAVCENGTVMRYNSADGSQEVIAENVGGLQSCAVDKNGIVYLLTYGKFSDTPIVGVGYAGGSLWQINTDGTLELAYDGNDMYVWRARGLAIDEYGYVYITGEANAWDNGNSSNIVRYNPGTRTIEKVTSGLDYGTFISYGSDGRFYQCLARDDLVVAFSEKAVSSFKEQNWSEKGVRVISYGGDFLPSDNGNITIRIGSLHLKAEASLSDGSGKVCGWFRVPAELLPEIDNTWTGSNNGKYPLPSVSFSGSGKANTAVMPCRTHTRSRWPLPDIYTPAEDFRDNPEAYLIYFEWSPENTEQTPSPDEFKNDTLTAPSVTYNSAKLDSADFSESAAFYEKIDRITTGLDLSLGNASCVTGADCVSFGFMITAYESNDSLTISSNKYSAEGNSGLILTLGAGGKINVSLSDGKNSNTVFDGYIEYDCFDGKWHTFSLENNFGKIRLIYDGIHVPLDGYENFDTEAEKYVGGIATNVTISSASSKMKLNIRAEAELSAEPISVSPPKTNSKINPAPIVCIAAAVMAVAAAVTVILYNKKDLA